jgi:aspartate-semialdehyde dehydrogenase
MNLTALPLHALQYAFNLFSHNSPMTENGYNEEEMKMVKETHKIWEEPDVKITATCIRVPIMRAHAESINLEFEKDVSEEEVCVSICVAHACQGQGGRDAGSFIAEA